MNDVKGRPFWPSRYRRYGTDMAPISERLWHRVEKMPNGCWEWRGNVSKRGYGSIGRGRANDGTVGTHRAAWEVTFGPIPDRLFVCHKCDNRICCNPAHLFLGTAADNSADMAAKGRAARPRGAACGMAKLTASQVAEIRERFVPGTKAILGTGRSSPELAAEFGISRKYVAKLAKEPERWAS